jgi:hypothetical protein
VIGVDLLQVQYNLLFRWFIGLAMYDVVWVPAVFTTHVFDVSNKGSDDAHKD